MSNPVLVEVLKRHEDLSEIGFGEGEVHVRVRRLRGRRQVEEDASRAVLEYHEETIAEWDVEDLIEMHEVGVVELLHHGDLQEEGREKRAGGNQHASVPRPVRLRIIPRASVQQLQDDPLTSLAIKLNGFFSASSSSSLNTVPPPLPPPLPLASCIER